MDINFLEIIGYLDNYMDSDGFKTESIRDFKSRLSKSEIESLSAYLNQANHLDESECLKLTKTGDESHDKYIYTVSNPKGFLLSFKKIFDEIQTYKLPSNENTSYENVLISLLGNYVYYSPKIQNKLHNIFTDVGLSEDHFFDLFENIEKIFEIDAIRYKNALLASDKKMLLESEMFTIQSIAKFIEENYN